MAEYPGGWLPLRYEERCRRKREELERKLQRFVAFCATVPDITRVVVYGSYARNDVSPWSDLDVLVVRDRDEHPLRMVDDLYRSGVGADIIAMRASDYPIVPGETPFWNDIRRDGIEVYARPES